MEGQLVTEARIPTLGRAKDTPRQTARGARVEQTQANGELTAAGHVQRLRGGDRVTPPVRRVPRGDTSQPSHNLGDGRNVSRKPIFRRSFASSEVQTIVFYGPSGCGKSRLVQKLIYSDPTLFTLAVLHTSRKRRLYEEDGRELSFVSQAEMRAGVESGRFVAHTEVTREQQQSRSGHLARSTSIYDLAEKDDPNGELFGITHEALAAARNAEKPIVVINFNSESAKQLKRAGFAAVYVLLHSSGATTAGADEVGADHMICIDRHDEATKTLEELVRRLVENVEQQGDKAVEQAKLEWDLVPTLQMSAATAKQLDELRRTVTFAEVLVHVQHVSLVQISGTKATGAKSGGAHGGPRNSKLSRSLRSEYGIVLTCAASNLDDSDPVHLLTIQTIYKKLTGNRMNCPRVGSHWQDIGFQSSDPADDLKGAGFLGPMQLLFFLDNPRTLSLAQEMRSHFERSTDRVPFCTLSLRVTQLVVSALKDGLLSKECTKRDQVFQVINEVYLGAIHRCYQLCKANKACRELGALVVEMGRQTSNKAGVKSLLKDGHTLVAERDGVGHAEMAPVSKAVMSDSFSQL